MTQRAYNFSAGPAVLPEPVLAQVQQEIMALPGPRASILEISHRSSTFKEILGAAEANVRKLLAVPENYSVLFLQGGGRLQFSMIPMNLLGKQQNRADYLTTLGASMPRKKLPNMATSTLLGMVARRALPKHQQTSNST
ncbi:MAG: aminotransferase class V-fold PLP-dependent enzyme [Planctomycetes bacterium]|nr:aminotransferase class V-fold PLP-dependent enzyme [Planctomycetota bacterium]